MQAAINSSQHGFTSVGAPELPLMSKMPNHQTTDDVPSVPPPANTSDKETIDPQKRDLTCTPDSTKTKAHRQVVGVDNVEWKAYGKATGLYNKHH